MPKAVTQLLRTKSQQAKRPTTATADRTVKQPLTFSMPAAHLRAFFICQVYRVVMPQIELQAENLRVQIDSTLGAGIGDFSLQSPRGNWTPLMRRAPSPNSDPKQLACFIMMPWPNRVRGAKFTRQGREYELDANGPDGSAIHGEVRTRPWKIRHRTPQSAVLEFDTRDHDGLRFPWDYQARVRYEVSPTGLEIDLSVTNTSDTPGPFGMGLHPYFMRRLWADDDTAQLRLPVTGHYPTENCIPTGEPTTDDSCRALSAGGPVDGQPLDDLFTVDGFGADLTWPSSGVRLCMTASQAATHAVVYTPRSSPGSESPASWFCVEPMTMATDAVNLAEGGNTATGLRVLEPGETQELGINFAIKHPAS
jgi:aldose 1-epimerase